MTSKHSYTQWIWPAIINTSIWLLYFYWETIFHRISFFIYPLWIVAILCFAISFLLILYHLIKHRNLSRQSTLYIATAIFVLYTHIFEAIRYDFRLQSHNYKHIAQLVEADKLWDEPEKGMRLPPRYSHLSHDGYISVSKDSGVTMIEFVTDPGIMFSYGTITYISNDRPPSTCFGTPFGQFERLEAQWYEADCWNP